MGTLSFNLVLEVAVYILPIPTLWRLELPLRQRLALVGVFAMGTLVVIGGAFHLYWVWVVIQGTYDLTCKASPPRSL